MVSARSGTFAVTVGESRLSRDLRLRQGPYGRAFKRRSKPVYGVVKALVTVSIADRHVVTARVVRLVHGKGPIRRHGVGSREQRDINAAHNQPFGQQRRELFPGPWPRGGTRDEIGARIATGNVLASRASWFCRTHRCVSIFIDLNHVASRVSAAGESFEASRSPRNDRVRVGAPLDCVALLDHLIEEHVEPILARA